MDHSNLEDRLRRATLTTPRIALAEIKGRASRRRGASGLRRLAIAAVGVWAIAWVAQGVVERQVTGLSGSPAPTLSASVDDERAPQWPGWTVACQREALDELLGDANAPAWAARESAGEDTDGRRRSATHQRWIGRVTHV